MGPTHCAGNTLDITLTNLFDGVYQVDTIKNPPLNLFVTTQTRPTP